MRRSVSIASCIVAVLAIAAASPAPGAEPSKRPPEASAKPVKEPNSKEKVVCATEEVAGSIIPRRVCRSQKQADAQRQAIEDLNSERKELGGTKTELLGMTPSGTLGR
jgi:hypothetical protein